MSALWEILRENAYPGRGIFLGRTPDGRRMVLVYFIMGRSENSRNRVFIAEGEGLRTQAFHPEKLSDPSLVIYSPVRLVDGSTVITNGDQTDTICEFLAAGNRFEEALRTRTFEPDPPIYTPRISGLVRGTDYTLSIIKNGGDGAPQRFFYEYAGTPGLGHLIHTYQRDGSPPPAFSGEPRPAETTDDIQAFTQQIWEGLHPENRISLFSRYVDLVSGAAESRIINKHERQGNAP